MTVKDLIAKLEKLHPSMPVHFAYPAKDYVRSTITGEVKHVDLGHVEWSAYHQTTKLVAEDADRDDEKPVDDLERVAVLS